MEHAHGTEEHSVAVGQTEQRLPLPTPVTGKGVHSLASAMAPQPPLTHHVRPKEVVPAALALGLEHEARGPLPGCGHGGGARRVGPRSVSPAACELLQRWVAEAAGAATV